MKYTNILFMRSTTCMLWKLFIELLGLIYWLKWWNMHLPDIVCRLHSYPLVLHFYRVLNTQRYYDKTTVVWMITFFWNVNGGWKLRGKKGEVVMYTHTNSHLGTKPNFHSIKMQQSMSVVKHYLLMCFAVTWKSAKIFMGEKICLPYWEKQNKIYLRP